jgi:hypothetical protein
MLENPFEKPTKFERIWDMFDDLENPIGNLPVSNITSNTSKPKGLSRLFAHLFQPSYSNMPIINGGRKDFVPDPTPSVLPVLYSNFSLDDSPAFNELMDWFAL